MVLVEGRNVLRDKQGPRWRVDMRDNAGSFALCAVRGWERNG